MRDAAAADRGAEGVSLLPVSRGVSDRCRPTSRTRTRGRHRLHGHDRRRTDPVPPVAAATPSPARRPLTDARALPFPGLASLAGGDAPFRRIPAGARRPGPALARTLTPGPRTSLCAGCSPVAPPRSRAMPTCPTCPAWRGVLLDITAVECRCRRLPSFHAFPLHGVPAANRCTCASAAGRHRRFCRGEARGTRTPACRRPVPEHITQGVYSYGRCTCGMMGRRGR